MASWCRFLRCRPMSACPFSSGEATPWMRRWRRPSRWPSRIPPPETSAAASFMLVHPAPGEGQPLAYVYRETAPAAAFPTMFRKEDTQYMYKSVAVPGTVRGFALAHKRFGMLPWSQLLLPAVAWLGTASPSTALLPTFSTPIWRPCPLIPSFSGSSESRAAARGRPATALASPPARTLQLLAERGPTPSTKGRSPTQSLAEMVPRQGADHGPGPRPATRQSSANRGPRAIGVRMKQYVPAESATT